jgi:ceramide glucosyltransferase
MLSKDDIFSGRGEAPGDEEMDGLGSELIVETMVLALLAAALVGCVALLMAVWFAPTFAVSAAPPRDSAPSVTVLKPLHGDEPGLFDNLASFCRQDYAGSVQIIFGVNSASDPAILVVQRIRAAFPDKSIHLIVDARAAGLNPKVANLANMSAHIQHELIVLADSDIHVQPDYLTRIVDALERANGGAVTCAYYGIAGGGFWSELSRLNVDSHFLPGVMVGVRCNFARPCFGATIAFRRDLLDAVGGFPAFADCLADDFAFGDAVRKIGEPVLVPPFAVGHRCNEQSLAELWGHELRWASTIRAVEPLGYLGWAALHPLPLALMALALGGGMPAFLLMLSAIGCRLAMVRTVQRYYGQPPHPYWLIPLRDLLSFAVYICGFVARDLAWRGRSYRVVSSGAMISEQRSPSP